HVSATSVIYSLFLHDALPISLESNIFFTFSGVTSLPSGSITLVLSICFLKLCRKESKYAFLNFDCSFDSDSVNPCSFFFFANSFIRLISTSSFFRSEGHTSELQSLFLLVC